MHDWPSIIAGTALAVAVIYVLIRTLRIWMSGD